MVRILARIFLCSVLLLTAAHAMAQVHFNADERRIITITDERRNADSLVPYLRSNDPKVARRAAIGIGNIGDVSVRGTLIEQFKKETRDTMADAEAFALGLLGPDKNAFDALNENVRSHPTGERLKAIARTAIKSDSSSAADIVHTLASEQKIGPFIQADAYVAFALRHETGTGMWDDLGSLANSSDPDIRWRVAYAFSRGADSLSLVKNLSTLNELLLDQGSINVRMFAALALGRLRNHDARVDISRAYRGEENWQVRVNMLRGFALFPSMDSLAFNAIQFAVENALRDSTTLIQTGLTAADVLEHFVISGTMTPTDSAMVRDWLDGFNGTDQRNDHVAQIVAARLTLPAVQVGTPTRLDAVQNYMLYHEPQIHIDALHAAGALLDTNYFTSILASVARLSAPEQVVALEALDSMWNRGKMRPWFRKSIEASHMAGLFRGLLVHISDAVQDQAVDATALGMMLDTSIVNDSAHRADALTQTEKYIPMFLNGRYRDALMASVVAAGWLQDRSPTVMRELRTAFDTANDWNDNELMDTIITAVHRIDPSVSLPKRLPIVSHIDWNELEHLPPKLIINFSEGPIILQLLTDDAPLTALNMVKLAREQWFAGNIIHRVVPNFVIQSGDPTATGWGGPGYTIRTEVTPREYDRQGIVGMASSGKDTESSQWFITQCPTPHLDTHYTIWAKVIDGMPFALDRSVGDQVTSIFPIH